jgi:hypothetical protein
MIEKRTIQLALIMFTTGFLMVFETLLIESLKINDGLLVSWTTTIIWAIHWVLMIVGLDWIINKRKFVKNAKDGMEKKE